MSDWDDGYVAAALHDLKKMLLNGNAGPRFGRWAADHADLTDLSGQLDACQQQTFAVALGSAPAPPTARSRERGSGGPRRCAPQGAVRTDCRVI